MIAVKTLHRWDLSPAEAVALQRELGPQTAEIPLPKGAPTRLIAGVDVSSTRFDRILTAGCIVWDSETGAIVDQAAVKMEGTYPYIPGLLSFREIPVLLEALKKITVVPDLFFVDGQGRAHPRRMGIAAHLGLLLDRPTIGVGKSRLTGTFSDVGPNAGDQSALMDDDEQIGVVLRTKAKCKPLFISVGHNIDLASAVQLVMRSLRGYRLPEPTRLAHNYVNAVRTGDVTHLSSQPSLL